MQGQCRSSGLLQLSPVQGGPQQLVAQDDIPVVERLLSKVDHTYSH